MDFSYPPEAEAFRAEFRAWLDEHLTEEFQGIGFDPDADDETVERQRAWNRLLADAGYAAIAWPVEYGGRGASLMEQVVFAEEMSRVEAPPTMNPIGITNVAPAIMEFGTEEQRRRYLPPMRRGDDVWCQGFSEPDAGSDLAALKTTAVRDGDHYVVNGQKVWTTIGHLATHCELLVRTDPEAPKHKGITCLLVEMDLPGVEVRPLVTITGDREFNELFFTDVQVPVGDRLGDENDGWRAAMTTLANERGSVVNLHLMSRKKVRRLLDLARSTARGPHGAMAADDPVLRQHLAEVYIQGEYLKLLADRTLSGALHGRPFGPESSLGKLVWSQLEQRISEVAAEILGPEAASGSWGRDRVHSRGLTIAGGTTQVNKNIIAQRVLGLPRA